MITKEKLERLIRELPSPPQNALRILNVLRTPDSGAEEVEKALRYDPGLTAGVLKMANSAYFGLPQRIGSVKQAVVLLGWKRISDLVMVSCMNTVMDRSVEGYDMEKGELWRHSVAVSVTSEVLAKELNIQGVDEIFTASLLHDIGKILLSMEVKEQIKNPNLFFEGNQSFDSVEKEYIGLDHAEAGAEILSRWGLPERTINAVRFHHKPDDSPYPDNMLDILHISDALCIMMGFTAGKEGLKYQPSSNAVKRLSLSQLTMEKAATYTMEKMNQLLNV
jgi:putative nucleotidyltransferase with HDIG domain